MSDCQFLRGEDGAAVVDRLRGDRAQVHGGGVRRGRAGGGVLEREGLQGRAAGRPSRMGWRPSSCSSTAAASPAPGPSCRRPCRSLGLKPKKHICHIFSSIFVGLIHDSTVQSFC
ncbi:hypothetical protein PVAP13_1NG072000 [Panicum virgatum]|uniref:Uncharacterized protein n=1 Tax=Panicum virgatum TaxID=38727 RepID=A0A8T0WLJ0_PANVG|nr:hypothetical protein PVAP13_1NG072000 [Panicum virgatum]